MTARAQEKAKDSEPSILSDERERSKLARQSVGFEREFSMTDLIRTLSILNEKAARRLSREQARAMMQTILEDTRNELPNMQIEAMLVALAARPVDRR